MHLYLVKARTCATDDADNLDMIVSARRRPRR